jgi:predicted enzyme related to lactoylglutathione lyase
MGERTSYAPGTFSWSELATSDAEAAKGFYSALFGWDYDDNPVGDGMVYSIARRDGHQVGALFSSDQPPPHWNCYVTVASADDAAARAAELGATVLQEAFDVLDAGRMAVIADPTGAALCLWEPRRVPGAELVNTPGALTWNDLVTPDAEAAASFYGALFGWTTEEMPDSGGYRVIRNGERANGGIVQVDPEGANAGTPATWLPYFGHDDARRAAAEAPDLGATVMNGPLEILGGTIAVLADPQGAVFAVWSGPYDD